MTDTVFLPPLASPSEQDESLELRPNFNRDGLVAAIAQDADTGDVLMMAWMNGEALAETLRTGRATYYSRSRGRLWRKGEESGHIQTVEAVLVDCDQDTLLLKVRQTGAACHTGRRSCFYRATADSGARLRYVNETDRPR